MTNPTTPFSWQMPTAADLVTDLPADFAVFGQAVATSMADLLGGTTGQILAKATNTDMDFTWVTNDVGDITAVTAGTGISGGGTSGAVTITNSMATEITAKGDLIAGTGSATFDNLPVGTNGQTLLADSTSATGLKWATPASGGMTLLSTTTLSGASTTVSSISQSYRKLVAYITGMSNATADGVFRVAANAGTTLASGVQTQIAGGATTSAIAIDGGYINTVTALARANTDNALVLELDQYTNTTAIAYTLRGYIRATTPNNMMFFQAGALLAPGAVTSLVFSNAGGNHSAGTVLLFGV